MINTKQGINTSAVVTKAKLTLWLTQNNNWVAVDHAPQIHLMNFPSMISRVEKNKMKVMMMMIVIKMVIIKNDACMSNANIKCRSLARRNKKNKKRTKRTGGHIDITHDIQTKVIIIIILAIENRMK